MSKSLEKLNKEKESLEKKIQKVSNMANAWEYNFNEIYDHEIIPFLATKSAIYGAGETFSDVYDKLEDKIAAHSKVGKAIATGVNYAISGAAASVVALGAIPLAVIESAYSIPVGAYQFVSEKSKELYNHRIYKAGIKLENLKEDLEKVNAEIAKETQGLEK